MVRIAVIGAGFMGRTHAAIFSSLPGVVLAGVCDLDEAKGRVLAAEFGCPYFRGLDGLLASGGADAASVCLPTFLHERTTVACLSRGLHVFCEKPAALERSGFDAMAAAAAAAGRVLMVGQVVRFWPEYVYAKGLVDSGTLGDVKMVFASRRSTLPAWSSWYRRPENSGGGLFDLHLHDVDYLCHVFGPVASVLAVGAENADGCWNHVQSILSFESGLRAAAEGIIEMPSCYPFSTTLRIVGSAAAVEHRMSAGSNLENVAAATRSTVLYREGGRPEPIGVEPRDAYRDELAHFAECAAAGTESPVVPVRSSSHVLDVMLALRESLRARKEVRL